MKHKDIQTVYAGNMRPQNCEIWLYDHVKTNVLTREIGLIFLYNGYYLKSKSCKLCIFFLLFRMICSNFRILPPDAPITETLR